MRTGRTEVAPELDPGKLPYRWTTCLSVGGSEPESLGCPVGGSGMGFSPPLAVVVLVVSPPPGEAV